MNVACFVRRVPSRYQRDNGPPREPPNPFLPFRSSQTFRAHFFFSLSFFAEKREPKGDESDECNYARRGMKVSGENTPPRGTTFDHLAGEATPGFVVRQLPSIKQALIF